MCVSNKGGHSHRWKFVSVVIFKTWLRPAAGRRGVVGVIDVPGEIRAGDVVEVRVYETPVIRLL
jgi:hypothetical protein